MNDSAIREILLEADDNKTTTSSLFPFSPTPFLPIRVNYSPSQMLSVPAQRPMWLADLIYFRTNRSVKYIQDGEFLILDESIDWSDLLLRLGQNAPFVAIYALSIILNFFLLFLSLSKGRNCYRRKIHCLLANLAVCNIFLSTGFLIYTFLIDVYYDVDSFNTLLNLNMESGKTNQIWSYAKQVVHTELIDNISLAQAFIILMVSIDRYMALFDTYSPNVSRCIFVWFFCLVPYFLALGVFDLTILGRFIGPNLAAVIRLSAFMVPTPLSLVFATCAVIRLVQKPPKNRLRRDDLSCSVTLLVILLVKLIEHFGLFLELIHANFNFEIVVGSKEGDAMLKNILWQIYKICHHVFLASPLYIAVLILCFVGYYQSRMIAICRKICCCCCCCKPRVDLDYNTETMRSIIAEQTRQRHMKPGYR